MDYLRSRCSLRKSAGKLKRSIKKHTRTAIQRKNRTWRVLCSDYPGLLFEINLEEKFAQGPFPSPRYLGANDENDRLVVEDLHIQWPQNYDTSGIGWVYREVFAAPEINPHAYEFGNVTMVPGSWVVDAGASEGFFVHYALMRGCNVLAIEPVPAFVRALKLTFQSEIAEGRVRVVEGAVGDLSGAMWLGLGASDVFSSRVDVEGDTPVRVYTLDELVAGHEIQNLSFVKMDIEGAELHVLEGAHDILRNQKPNLSIAVYHAATTALALKGLLIRIAPHYRVRFRGVWLRGSDIPRPYILMASPK